MGADGLFFGNGSQFHIQALSVVVASVYSFVVRWIIPKILDAVVGLRFGEEGESDGVDPSRYGEVGCTL